MLPDFRYESNDEYDIECAKSEISELGIRIFVTRKSKVYYAEIFVNYDECYYRIEMLEPSDWCFDKH